MSRLSILRTLLGKAEVKLGPLAPPVYTFPYPDPSKLTIKKKEA